MAHQRAGVDICKHWNPELFEIFFCNLLRTPVGADAGKLADDQALDIGTRSFVVFWIGSVVSDFRIGENDELASVGRVGENFLIAGNGSIENYFPVTFAFGSVAFAAEDSSIFQRKHGLHSDSREWILEILTVNRRSAKKLFCDTELFSEMRHIQGKCRHEAADLGRVPETFRRLSRAATTLAAVGLAFDHVEKQIFIASS